MKIALFGAGGMMNRNSSRTPIDRRIPKLVKRRASISCGEDGSGCAGHWRLL